MILNFFRFFLKSFVFLCLITRDRFCKKLIQNEMTMFFLNWMSLRDFYRFLCWKTIFFIFFIFCFPIDTLMKLFITWFSKFLYLFPDWYTNETHFACNEELRHRGVKKIRSRLEFLQNVWERFHFINSMYELPTQLSPTMCILIH